MSMRIELYQWTCSLIQFHPTIHTHGTFSTNAKLSCNPNYLIWEGPITTLSILDASWTLCAVYFALYVPTHHVHDLWALASLVWILADPDEDWDLANGDSSASNCWFTKVRCKNGVRISIQTACSALFLSKVSPDFKNLSIFAAEPSSRSDKENRLLRAVSRLSTIFVCLPARFLNLLRPEQTSLNPMFHS